MPDLSYAPVIIIPGYFAAASEYNPLAQSLKQSGLDTTVMPIEWYDWVPTLGGRPMTPVLTILAQTINQVRRRTGAQQVQLVGHSAGGWIARLVLGSVYYDERIWGYRSKISRLVTLGTPHLSKERFTKLNMDFVNNTYPGAFHPEVEYICVAGRAVYGENNWFTRQSYELTAGRADCWGDGVTPIEAAHLAGATNITIEGALHSPRGGRFWYGSEKPLSEWVPYLKQ